MTHRVHTRTHASAHPRERRPLRTRAPPTPYPAARWQVNKGERNYHSFYHLAAAAPADERKRLGLEKGPDGFAYLSPGKCAERPPPPPPSTAPIAPPRG